LDPPIVPSGLPRYMFSTRTILPIVLYHLHICFLFSHTPISFWVTSTSTTHWQIPAALSLKASLFSPRDTWMLPSTSHTTSSTPPVFTLVSHLSHFETFRFGPSLRAYLSLPFCLLVGHTPPLHRFRPRPMCNNTKTTCDHASPLHCALGPPRPAGGRAGTGCLHRITLPSKAHAELSE